MLTELRAVVVAAVAWACVFAAGAPAAEQITNADPRFSLTVPEGFRRDDQIVAASPKFIYAFRKPGSGEGKAASDIIVIVERMGRTIGREPPDPQKVKGRVLTTPWNGVHVYVVQVAEKSGDVEALNYNIQIPLKTEAIQLRVAGNRDQAAELQRVGNAFLAGLTGETNWPRQSAGPPAPPESPAYVWFVRAVTVGGVIAGFVGLWLLRRRSRRGTVLVVAILIYGASWLLPDGGGREVRAVAMGTRVLGFLGLVLGLYDLVRHPARKQAAGAIPPAGGTPGNDPPAGSRPAAAAAAPPAPAVPSTPQPRRIAIPPSPNARASREQRERREQQP